MMLLKSKKYPFGKYQILRLVGNHFNFKKSIGFWKHPIIPLGVYADWSLRLMFIEIKKWLPEEELVLHAKMLIAIHDEIVGKEK